jgi:hypothetical protein
MYPVPGRTDLEMHANAEWHKLHLPNKPGKYRVYITTDRVFGQSASHKTYMGRGVPISSNVVMLEVR